MIGEEVRAALERHGVLGALATVRPDGTPHQVYLWYLVRGDSIVVNGRVGRTWPTNLLHDPRFSFIVEAAPGWVSLNGEAEPVHDPAQAQQDIAEMAYRYEKSSVADNAIRKTFRAERRISFLLHPTRIVVHPDDTMRRRRLREDRPQES